MIKLRFNDAVYVRNDLSWISTSTTASTKEAIRRLESINIFTDLEVFDRINGTARFIANSLVKVKIEVRKKIGIV